MLVVVGDQQVGVDHLVSNWVLRNPGHDIVDEVRCGRKPRSNRVRIARLTSIDANREDSRTARSSTWPRSWIRSSSDSGSCRLLGLGLAEESAGVADGQ